MVSDDQQNEDKPTEDLDDLTEVSVRSDQPRGPAPHELQPGSRVGRYVLLETIGQGGMGVVYKAYDPGLDRRIAIKIMRVALGVDTVLAKKRLMREAQALARLSHPNVVAAYDVGVFEEAVFVAMEFVEGQTARQWLEERQRTREEILAVYIEAGRGLQTAHDTGLIHRDFKPANVMVGRDGRVRVLDFGLARAHELGDETTPGPEAPVLAEDQDELAETIDSGMNSSQQLLSSDLTRVGAIVGSPPYMAPEQFLGRTPGVHADQFSFCVSLYEALYGTRPFAGLRTGEVKRNVLAGNVKPAPADTPVPAWLRAILLRGLSKNPEDRWPSMQALLGVLGHDPDKARVQRRAARRRRALMIGLVLLAVLAPLAIWYHHEIRTVEQCKDVTEELSGVWDDATRDRVERAFLATGVPYAADTFSRVSRALDGYVERWSRARAETCEARWRRGTESAQLFDRKMTCLARRLRELDGLVGVFTGADAAVIPRAVQASLSLGDIETCADEDALQSACPLPDDEDTRAGIESIRMRLSGMKPLLATGKHAQGARQARDLVLEAGALRYHPVLAESLFNLGNFLFRAGRDKEAEQTLRDAARVAGMGKHAVWAGRALSLMVYIVGTLQQRNDEALVLAADTEILLDLGGGDEQDKANLYNNLGLVLSNLNRFQEAMDRFERALALDVQHLGPDHPNVAQDLGNMGLILRERGALRQSREHLERALDIFRKSLGPTHPDIAYSYGNLGLVAQDLREYDQARTHFKAAVDILEKLYGKEHPDVAWCLTNLGWLSLQLGAYDRAHRQFQRAMTIVKDRYGPGHPDVGRNLRGLAGVQRARGALDEAAQSLRRALEICEKATGPEHLSVGEASAELGMVQLEQGWPAEARASFERSLRIAKKVLGPDNRGLAPGLFGLGELASSRDDHDQARKRYARVLSLCEDTVCPPEVLHGSQFGLAKALWLQGGEHDRARELAGAALEGYRKTPGRFGGRMREVRQWLHRRGHTAPDEDAVGKTR